MLRYGGAKYFSFGLYVLLMDCFVCDSPVMHDFYLMSFHIPIFA